MTPRVLVPLGSNFIAICRESEVDISAFAGMTARIIVLGSPQYLSR